MPNPSGNTAPKPIQDVSPPSDTLGNPVKFNGLDSDPYAPKNSTHQVPANPIAGTAAPQGPVHHVSATGENDLDSVLKDVNQSVKNASQPAGYSKTASDAKQSLSQPPSKAGGRLAALRGSDRLVPAIIAVAAATILSAAAWFAFRNGTGGLFGSQNSTTSPPSSQAVKAAELLNSMAQNLQTQLGGLNDAQDFNADNLSDKSLGL